MKKDFVSLFDVTPKELELLLTDAAKIKKSPKKYRHALDGKTLAMLFQKTSTRTRVSFEVGMEQLGGHGLFLDWRTTNFTLGALDDEIKTLSRYVDGIMFRAYKNEDVVAAAKASDVPLINGLDDLHHPCQTLADLLTIKEYTKNFRKTIVAYVGDGNNVCNSLIIGCAMLGIKINVATPKGYEPAKFAVDYAEEKKCLQLSNEPHYATKDAEFVYTDTWVSMGQEKETEKRKKDFESYTVDKALLGKAFFMHCLPAHIGLEVTDEVIHSKQSIVFDQAENRLHAQKALLVKLLAKPQKQ